MITSGSIRKRSTKKGSGSAWQITIELPADPATGKRNRRYKTVTGSKKEAEYAMLKMIEDIEKGYNVTNDRITVSEWLEMWFEVYIVPNVSVTTLSRYRSLNKLYIQPLLGAWEVRKLSTIAVQSWVNQLKVSPASGKELSAATIKHAYNVLKGAMGKAVLANIIRRSPCDGIILPKGKKKAAVVYDEKQIQTLIRVSRGTIMELVIDLELCLGMRRGELLGLQWADIDWKNKQIHIHRNRVVVGGRCVIKEPKTEAGNRIVDVPDGLMQQLRAHQKTCAENRLKLGKGYTVTDFVIVHDDGKPIYPEYISQLLKKLQKRGGLPGCRFHDLRHLCASIMLKQGVNVKVAQHILGHADASTTLNIYSHVMPSSVKEAAQKIGELVYGT